MRRRDIRTAGVGAGMAKRKLSHEDLKEHAMIRQAALDAGEKTYNTGKPCVNGHMSARLVTNRHCLMCDVEHNRRKCAKLRAKNHPDIEYENAVAEGRVRYMSKRPCDKGHVGERYVKDHRCVQCRREYREQLQMQHDSRLKQQYEIDKSALQTIAKQDVALMISKLTIATELLFYAEVCDVDSGEIAKSIIRAFDNDMRWWLPLYNKPLSELLNIFNKEAQQRQYESSQYHADAANAIFSISAIAKGRTDGH